MGLTTAIIVLIAALVILALGAALLLVCRALSTASTQLSAILETIGKASETNAPPGPVLAAIKDDLAAANKLLVPLLAGDAEAPNGATQGTPLDDAFPAGAPPATPSEPPPSPLSSAEPQLHAGPGGRRAPGRQAGGDRDR